MYYIYRKDYKKFEIQKRNRILEKFYLFKCFSFSRFPLMNRSENLCNRFDVYLEIYTHFSLEDEDQEKFKKFIKFLYKNYKSYDINSKDLLIIESVIICSLSTNEYGKAKALDTLKKMSNYNSEALYKYVCFIDEKETKEKEEKFKILYNKQYYRSYVDYALFLNSQKNIKEALEVLTLARKHGIMNSGYLYYDIYIDSNDFQLIMKEAVSSSFSKKCELYNLFEILINDIIAENIYLLFEFFFLRKIAIKHYKLENEINHYFLDFTKDIINFLMKMTSEPNEKKRKDIIKSIYSREDYYDEIHLATGVLYFYGINKLLEIDNQKALYYFKISFNNSTTDSYKRFCYYFIYRTSKKLYEQNKLVNNYININNNIIDEKTMKETEKTIYELFHKSLYQQKSSLSSSYFYFLSRLTNKKIGNNGDKLLEFIYLNKAKNYQKQSPGSGTMINIYRRYKSGIILEKSKDEFSEVFINIKKKDDSEGYGEDGSFCPICFENKRNEIALPCKHLFCSTCLSRCEKCPICRTIIIMKYKVNSS
jgi:hypothetical protein